MTITDQVLGPLLRADPARPRITHYDDATGSRVELSGATLANWAAKTANWLRDELDVQPGDTVVVLLPPHWQTAGALLGAWWCGATVDPRGVARCKVTLCGADHIADATGADELAAVGLDAMGAGIAALPPGVRDFAGEVRAHGDTFLSGGPGPDAEMIIEAARARATQLGLTAGDRLLCTTSWNATVPGEVLLAVLAADTSLVQCTAADLAALPRRCAAERVTATLGLEVPPLRRAG
ncbi:MAG: TIGR03089 family protein [Pseudonocardiales bacterium]|nr:TIGR03089 family protein [Pseudonocardiales bacterium]MBV9029028.1 TIGR03089 family protein [Pseudonocardiales bacterium]MBW0008995.1 TIGR03089 family protein [Pseudonocardiales bacterium]